MTNREFAPQGLPPEYQIPAGPKEVILSLLGECNKSSLEAEGARVYHPIQTTEREAVNEILNSYTSYTATMARDAGQLIVDERRKHLLDLLDDAIAKSGAVPNLAHQLNYFVEINDLLGKQKNAEARVKFETLAEKNDFNPERPVSVLKKNSKVRHPLAQALTIDLMTKIIPDFNTEELQKFQQIKLGLCWHFLPHDQLHTVHALTECLDSFASFRRSTGEAAALDEAVELLLEGSDLAKSVQDPLACQLRLKASLIRCEQSKEEPEQLNEALKLSTEALQWAYEFELEGEPLAVITGNHLLNFTAFSLRQEEISKESLRRLTTHLGVTITQCSEFEQPTLLVSLFLAVSRVYNRLSNDLEDQALAIIKEQDKDDINPSMHPFARTIYEEILAREG